MRTPKTSKREQGKKGNVKKGKERNKRKVFMKRNMSLQFLCPFSKQILWWVLLLSFTNSL